LTFTVRKIKNTGVALKSSAAQLAKRGFIAASECGENYPEENIRTMLDSNTPAERTLAVRIIRLKKLTGYTESLFSLLAGEQALYTKLELQETLAFFGTHAVPGLVKLLGSIGHNQHKVPDNVDTGKKSYPCCRDIAARILCLIGQGALPALREILKSGARRQKLEAIDAVGHISYNSGNHDCEDDIVALFSSDECDSLMRWKLVRALQGFNTLKSENLLKDFLAEETDAVMKNEIERSLSRMKARA
jgi:hypothetical protein